MELVESYLEYIQEFDPGNVKAAADVAKGAGKVAAGGMSPLMGAGIALSAANMLVMATRTYKEYFTKVARQCADLAPDDKALCMLRAKMLAKNAQLQTIKSKLGKCKNDKCKGKLVEKMKALAGEVKFLSDRMQATKKKAAMPQAR